jgi:hypothetical protein
LNFWRLFLSARGFSAVISGCVLDGNRLKRFPLNEPPKFTALKRRCDTAKDEDVRVKVGDAFDVVAVRKQTDYKVISRNVYEYAYEIKIRNHKESPITVVVNEPIGGDWEMISSTFEAKKTAAFAAQFNVPVSKDGEATLSYGVRVRY